MKVPNAFRDPKSKAVIFTDRANYKRAQLRKKHSLEVYKKNMELANLKFQLNEMTINHKKMADEFQLLRELVMKSLPEPRLKADSTPKAETPAPVKKNSV